MRWCVRVLSRELKMNCLERECEWNKVKIGIDDTIVITRSLLMALEYFVISWGVFFFLAFSAYCRMNNS